MRIRPQGARKRRRRAFLNGRLILDRDGKAGRIAQCARAGGLPDAARALRTACQKLRAQQATPDGMAEIGFDLPAQPLKQALAQYDRLTSLSVFFPSELRRAALRRRCMAAIVPEDALRRLVEGTGLTGAGAPRPMPSC